MCCERRLHAMLTLAGVLAATAGCTSDGQIVIQNNTNTQLTGELNHRGFALSGYESIQLTVKVGTKVLFFGPNEKEVELVAESCTLFPLVTTVLIEAGEVRRFNIDPDAVCIKVENQGTFDVIEVLRRDVTNDPDADWVSVLLDGPLVPTATLSWRLDPGIYEVRMIDECDEVTEIEADARTAGTVRYARHVGEEFCL